MFCEMHVSIFRNSYAALLPSQATSSTPTNLQTINLISIWRVGVFPHFCFSSDSCCGHQLKWQIATVCVESQTMKLLFASCAVRFAGMQFNALHAHTHESVCFFFMIKRKRCTLHTECNRKTLVYNFRRWRTFQIANYFISTEFCINYVCTSFAVDVPFDQMQFTGDKARTQTKKKGTKLRCCSMCSILWNSHLSLKYEGMKIVSATLMDYPRASTLFVWRSTILASFWHRNHPFPIVICIHSPEQ